MGSGLIKSLLDSNPIAKHRRIKMRRALKNTNFTLLAPNCLAGILLHDLGLRFMTPTVNLMMTQTDFLQFTLHLREYIREELRFVDLPDENCPCAYLGGENLPSVTIIFTHYRTAEEAKAKWLDRITRINFDNIFVLLEERDGITEDDLHKLSLLNVRGVVAFTCNQYDAIPYTVYLEKYHSAGEVGNILKKNHLTGSREYEKYFDFIQWFNKADGKNYDVSEFVRG